MPNGEVSCKMLKKNSYPFLLDSRSTLDEKTDRNFPYTRIFPLFDHAKLLSFDMVRSEKGDAPHENYYSKKIYDTKSCSLVYADSQT